MALGTLISRATGFARAGLLAAVIGTSLNADLFDIANTIPNTLYILLAGGVFNVVLVPQLIRSVKQDADGGDAYANRVMTLGLLVLGVGTTVLIALVPQLLHLVFEADLFTPEFEPQRASAQLLMLVCMPQVLFYGAFVLVGQILNAQGRFGPMMWAPIVNNAVACGVIVAYFLMYGATDKHDGFTRDQALLLGCGSTVAIATQFVVLVPYLRAAGFRFHPRFDFRGTGLGHTLRLGVWTLLFVLVNMLALVVVNRIATGATLEGAANDTAASGSTVYGFAYLASQLPHGVITVSLATAIVPTLATLAAEFRYTEFRHELARTIRVCLLLVAPIAAMVASLGPAVVDTLSGMGALAGSTTAIGNTLQAFSLSMVTFSLHYLMLRGFYADEDSRTPFFMQVGIASVNVVLAIVLTQHVQPDHVAPMLALSFGSAYLVGSGMSVTLLSRRIGPFMNNELRTFLLRLAGAVALAVFVTGGVVRGFRVIGAQGPGGGIIPVSIAGLFGLLTYVAAVDVLRLVKVRTAGRTLMPRRPAASERDG